MKKLFLLFLVIFGALVLKAQSRIETATPNEKLIVERSKCIDGWWETNIIFLTQAETTLIKTKLSNRKPDSVTVFIGYVDTTLVKRYWLNNGQSLSCWFPHKDELGKYQYSIFTCKTKGETYYLKIDVSNRVLTLDKFIEVIQDGVYAGYNFVDPMLGHFDYTKHISPYRWFNIGMKKRVLQDIKSAFMASMTTL